MAAIHESERIFVFLLSVAVVVIVVVTTNHRHTTGARMWSFIATVTSLSSLHQSTTNDERTKNEIVTNRYPDGSSRSIEKHVVHYLVATNINSNNNNANDTTTLIYR